MRCLVCFFVGVWELGWRIPRLRHGNWSPWRSIAGLGLCPCTDFMECSFGRSGPCNNLPFFLQQVLMGNRERERKRERDREIAANTVERRKLIMINKVWQISGLCSKTHVELK